MKEDAWRSQTAGRNIHPLLARAVLSAVRWVQLCAEPLFVSTSSCCSAVSHSATSCTAGAPGYLKSMWTSVSAGKHLHWGSGGIHRGAFLFWIKTTWNSIYSVLIIKNWIFNVLIFIFFPLGRTVRNQTKETNSMCDFDFVRIQVVDLVFIFWSVCFHPELLKWELLRLSERFQVLVQGQNCGESREGAEHHICLYPLWVRPTVWAMSPTDVSLM